MFLPVAMSQSVGGFFSGLTMLRWGVRPHIGHSPVGTAGLSMTTFPLVSAPGSLALKRSGGDPALATATGFPELPGVAAPLAAPTGLPDVDALPLVAAG